MEVSNMPAIPRKLTPEQVVKLRALKPMIDAGLMSQRAVAAHFDLSQSTVSDILSGKKWAICPTVEWQPVIVLVDTAAAADAMQQNGGRFGGPGGVTSFDGSQAANDEGDADVVAAADTEELGAAQ